MADAAKQLSFNGGKLVTEFKSFYSIFRTRRTVAFAYGFMFVFVAFTVFLAFSPSNSTSSPLWFTNIFSSSSVPSSSSSSAASDSSYRSQFSSIFSYFHPINSSSHPSSPVQFNATRSPNTVSQSPSVNQVAPSTKNATQSTENSDKVAVLHSNKTAIAKKGSSSVRNQTQSTENSSKAQTLKANQTAKVDTPKAPVPANQSTNYSSLAKENNGKGVKVGAEKGVLSNQTASLSKKQSDEKKQSSGTNSGNQNDGKKQSNASNSGNQNDGNKQINGSNSGNQSDGKKQSNASNSGNQNDGKKQSNASNSGNQNDGNKQSNGSNSGNQNDGKKQSNVSNSGNQNDGNKQSNGSNSGNQKDGKKQSNGTNSEVVVKQGIESLMENLMKCDLFDGEWIHDDSYPLYKPGACSFIDEQFSCVLNGRPDKDFQKMKWKPKGCSLPRLNGVHMLELLRGKRLVFVGDSLNRNMWESLVCILRSSAKDPSKVFEAHGRYHFRGESSYSFIFKDYNFSVEFFVSPFLVQEWEMPDKNGSKKETLRLDLVGRSSDNYKTADIIIFNTGHWWTHEKTSKGKDYYQEGSHVYGELNVLEAFRKALTTWARWVDANVNPTKSMVFFRGYSASHFSGGQWNSGGACDSETEPIKNETYLKPYPPKMKVLESVLKGMKTHVTYLNITRLTDFRKDGHPSIYRKQNLSNEERRSPLRFQDCSHWCLPGVPDAWNELFYAELLIKQNKMIQHQNQKRYR